MDSLPSYEEATTGADWLQLAAPFVATGDWRRCCLVSSHFYRHFAARLWLDPLVTSRRFGLHPNDDLAWYRRFINIQLKLVRLSTRALVRSLDFRDFAVRASGLYSTEASERAISESFREIPSLFPRLLCLLVDGHPELNPEALIKSEPGKEVDGPENALQLLDLAHCPHELTSRYFRPRYFRDLVYLDLSGIPGSVKSAVIASLKPDCLPELRVLKVRGREMDDSTAVILFQTFQRRLWSLDISENKLTDACINALIENCFTALSYRTDTHFEIEGKLTNPRRVGSITQGPFQFIEESDSSGVFNHPARFLPDAPPYLHRADQGDLQEWQVVRSTGVGHPRDDSADGVRRLLLKDALSNTVSSTGNVNQQIRTSHGGITHLYLNGNRFTSGGIERLVKHSLGRLEHVECDSCRVWSPCLAVPKSLPESLQVYGFFDTSHLLRPVFSSNLRSLRLHHSVVTHVPSVTADGLTPLMANIHAETTFRERVQLAYPIPFSPDMNPRVVSLTLTGIPTRSVGPLISTLTRFLDLASAQQQAVASASRLSAERGSPMLTGLRHIRLELEPDYSDDSPSLLLEGNGNFDDILDPAGDTIQGGPDVPREISSRATQQPARGASSASTSIPDPAVAHEYLHLPENEYLNFRVDASESWNGNMFTIPVWVGSGVPGPQPAVNEYMVNLRDRRLHRDVGPAMPNHVEAGVPSGSYIFYAAWDSMVFPKRLPKIDKTPRGLVRDVATAIKEYRQQTKGTAKHWPGRLELVRMESGRRYQSSDYWR
ncbi:hypothetical protein JX266_011313 [Neoarthrinium moseri]|nr:hypothetical protein JX266_011313 [Neoarthrinium moseri]